jgi:hypothetical protein
MPEQQLTVRTDNSAVIQSFPWSHGTALVPNRHAFLQDALADTSYSRNVVDMILVCHVGPTLTSKLIVSTSLLHHKLMHFQRPQSMTQIHRIFWMSSWDTNCLIKLQKMYGQRSYVAFITHNHPTSTCYLLGKSFSYIKFWILLQVPWASLVQNATA